MKNAIKLQAISFVLLLFLCITVNGQGHEHRNCGADEYHEQLMQNSSYAKQFWKNQKLMKEKINSRSIITCTDGVYVIPVAVHFNGNITNANMACINSAIDNQINVMNQDFGGYNADVVNYCSLASACPGDFPPNVIAGDACIQFCLATQNHPGPSGIADGDGAITFGQFDFTSEAPLWSGYFNFFVSDIAPPGQPSGLLGLAPLGGGANPDGNGMFVVASSFGGLGASCVSGAPLNNSSQYDLGRTGTHEAGHYFNLQHVFAGGSCAGAGDGISDTPTQSEENGGDILSTIDLMMCGADNNSALNTCGTNDFWFNYMDYSNDNSLLMFTKEQATNMYANAGLGINSGSNPYKTNTITCAAPNYQAEYPNGCPSAAVPVSAFTTDYQGAALCPGLASINVTDLSTNFPTSWNWTFSGAGVNPTSSTEQNPTITYTSAGTITISLTTANNAGTDMTPEVQMLDVFTNDPLNCGDCNSDFFDTGGAAGNYTNDNMTWTFCSDDFNKSINVDFQTLDLYDGNFGGDTSDLLFVKQGPVPPTGFSDADFIGYTNLFFVETTPGNYSVTGNLLEGTGNCMSFFFRKLSSFSATGWEANIDCTDIPTCTDGQQNQDEVFVDCGGATCPACPSACGSTFYDVGGASNDMGLTSQTWQICADEPTESLVLDFTSIDLGPAFNDAVIRFYEVGSTGGDFSYYVTQNSVFVPDGTGNVFPNPAGNTITTVGRCFDVTFVNNDDVSAPGWAADVSCCEQCPSAVSTPATTDLMMEESCSPTASGIAAFRQYDPSDSRDCNAPFGNSQTMLIQCNSIGGTLNIEVGINSGGGDIDAFLYGPITGTCPNYANVTQVDCESGPGPLLLNRMAGANDLYILEVRSANEGMISVMTAGAALPVEFSNFEAIPQDDRVLVKWSTASEINNFGFHIERSLDSRLFDRLDFYPTISATSGADYNFVDKEVSKGNGYYYRIAQEDYDGRITYTDIDYAYLRGEDKVSIYPNPASDRLTIVIPSNTVTSTKYSIHSAVGTLVKTGTLTNTANTLDISTLSAGIYTIQFLQNSNLITQQIVISK